MRLLRALIVLSTFVTLTSCSDDNTSTADTNETPASTTTPVTAPATTTAAATTTTVSLADLTSAYADAGPHPVGVTTLALPAGNAVEVWYPAVEGTTGTETYDVRDFTPEAIKALLTADVPATYSYDAGRDADMADGTYPIVLFSHGFTGMRLQSSFLTSHLASWGMIVLSTDHPSRDLINVLGGTATGTRADSVNELLGLIDLIVAEGDTPTSRFAGHVDAEHIAAVGHSAGGGTVLGAADDVRVDGYVSLASGALGGGGADPAATTTVPTLPAKPSFFLAGSVDAVVPAATVTKPSFEAAPAPSLLWVIEGVGHNGFDDFCTLGGGTGIIGVAEASGLGAFLDGQPQFRKLGEDGCIPPAVAVDTTFPIINHAVTAWLRNLFGVDSDPVGLGPEVAGEYVATIEIESK